MDRANEISRDPIEMLRRWLAAAEQSEPNDPNAVALATATKAGVPSVRMVLIKGVDVRGLRFFTNTESRKGHELHENPVAALCFHWKTLRKQVRVEGRVQTLDRAEVEEYFHSRSRASQIAAAISEQSRLLASREELDRRFTEYRDQLGGDTVSLPASWGGFLLVPDVFEFWSNGEDRLHDRLQFRRAGDEWLTSRLYP